MSREEILERVRRAVREDLACEVPVDESSDLLKDLQLDSLQRVTLAVALENDFEICFDPEEEQALATIGDVVDLLEREAAAQPGESHAQEA